MKKLLFICLIILGTGSLFAQDDTEVKDDGRLDFTANIQNNHLWRGLIITDKPVVMGNLSYALDKEKKWKVGIWGASALTDDKDGTHYKEINYYVQYSDGRLYIGLWDLFNSRNINTTVASDDIFNYSNRRTAHIIDLRTNYTFGPSFPLNIEADIMLYGGANAGEVVLKPDGSYKKNKYSTYVQVSYPVIAHQKVNLDAFVGGGFAINDSTFLYGNGKNSFDIVNVGIKASKALKITEHYTLPVSMMAMWNPSNKYARIQLAATVF
ncbi:hypothetical protein ACNFU2_16125 [Chryseobacterium sp. PTM-20240506]|uniref:hypothetical protein n=1 Tax=unclassified Chryseobacterium TaxID=2593645 RepID=UPI00235A3388|nr:MULTISPECIES: hypothetical protein [unclassified Chryseobacterium]MDC8106419.1 hypothetical protein [Chryseobacterium sp. B21-037]MDQ1804922.1 hypothetical protein [Chryseobacterium sp. CKR4-1]